jgi:hypothetical protein
MSMGLPVVSSPQAARGLGPVPADLVTLADGAAATIEAVASRFADPQRARDAGERAAAWVREHWRWERMYDHLDVVLDELGVAFPH